MTDLERILRTQRDELLETDFSSYVPRKEEQQIVLDSNLAQIVIGVRRSGKSTLCYQALQSKGVKYAYGRKHILADVPLNAGANGIDLISYDDIQFQWATKDFLRGNIADVRNEIGNVMVVFGKSNPLDLGDTLELNGKTLHVSALLSDSPFSESDIPTVICSEETFEDFCGASNYSVIDLQLKKSAGDETVAQIRELLGDNLRLSDRRASKTEVNSTYLAFTILVYSFRLKEMAALSVSNRATA